MQRIAAFVELVLDEGRARYRDFPWRETRDPYAVLVSEVMLQQTQVARVVPYFERWMADFPSLEAVAAAPLEAVLRDWQGLGYNRRAVALKRAAEAVCEAHRDRGGRGPVSLPASDEALRALPGVGPATAAGVRAFAFDEPVAYLETNVRAVFLHELLADGDRVADREIVPLVIEAAGEASRRGAGGREWNYALLDYGAYLKRTLPNPSRRSAHHARQSAFEGSRRQRRARMLRAVMDEPGMAAEHYAERLSAIESGSAREGVSVGEALTLLEALQAEGFLTGEGERWRVV